MPTFEASDPMDRSHRIPLEELTRPDPILFYAEIPLYEDELHDNGSSHLLVRIVRLSISSGTTGGREKFSSALCPDVFSSFRGSR